MYNFSNSLHRIYGVSKYRAKLNTVKGWETINREKDISKMTNVIKLLWYKFKLHHGPLVVLVCSKVHYYMLFQGSEAGDKLLDKFNMLCNLLTQQGDSFVGSSRIINYVHSNEGFNTEN